MHDIGTLFVVAWVGAKHLLRRGHRFSKPNSQMLRPYSFVVGHCVSFLDASLRWYVATPTSFLLHGKLPAFVAAVISQGVE